MRAELLRFIKPPPTCAVKLFLPVNHPTSNWTVHTVCCSLCCTLRVSPLRRCGPRHGDAGISCLPAAVAAVVAERPEGACGRNATCAEATLAADDGEDDNDLGG
ncbi:hypothetical protein EDC01DRAFT_628267 [Geopyxis carbonaria]|nr:hypothetical protein EDC01DRAFT_628267 [Geopyxis carbonaria]